MLGKMKTRRVLAIALAAVMALSTPMMSFAETSGEEIVEEVVQEPVAEEVVQEPVAEEVVQEPVAEEVAQEPIAEEVTEEPVIESVTEEVIAPSEPEIIEVSSPSEDTEETEEVAASPSEIILEDTAEDGMKVTLKADPDAFEYIEGLSLDVSVVSEEEAKEADEELESETKNDNIAKRVTYDIRVMHGDEELEPLDGKKVKVEFTMAEVPSGADAVNVYHIDEEAGVETIVEDAPVNEATGSEISNEDAVVITSEATAEKKDADEVEEEDIFEDGDIIDDVTVAGETDSFSLYTVDFTYEEKTVSIPGDTTENLLSDILAEVGIEGKIVEAKAYQDASCSELAENGEVKDGDKVLFRVYQIENEWYIDAVNAFSTEHGLVVKTADEAEYKIRVTDVPSITVIHFRDWDYIKRELVDAWIGDAEGSKAKGYYIISGMDAPTTLGVEGQTSWYVVSDTVKMYSTVTVNGDVHLILKDGSKMEVKGNQGFAGIYVNGSNSLTIYGQEKGTGQLVANGGDPINNQSTQEPVSGAGIGGGGFPNGNEKNNGENITINGGTVTATGGGYGAGIGGGRNGTGNNITINGGTVTATGGGDGAGIGGGENGTGQDIVINGRTVTATGGGAGAGIGGGENGTGQDIVINGGTVTANGRSYGAGIGGGRNGTGNNIIIYRGTVTATGGSGAAGIGGGENGTGQDIFIKGGKVTTNGGYNAAGIGAGNYATAAGITIDGGEVTANGSNAAAGIGGGYKAAVTGITITGGEVTTTGGSYGAGIGCADGGTADNITISGGTVTATGGDNAAGIGGGYKAAATGITITGGEVTTTGGSYGAGIGVADEGTADNITISGGTVTATGGDNAAGIGSGESGTVSNITISGGELTAAGGIGADGIGNGGDPKTQASNIKATEDVGVWVSDDNSNFVVIKTKGAAEQDITNDVKSRRYAKSNTTQYSVTYDSNGATGGIAPVDAAKYGFQEEVTVMGNSGNLEKGGLPFAGWATRKEVTEGYVAYKEGDTFNIEGDTTLYAQWGVPYIAADGTTQVCKEYSIVNGTDSKWGTAGKATWYVVKDLDMDISGSVTCVGDVNLILSDKTKLTVTGTDGTAGITVSGEGNSLTIYGQTYGTGKLEATGGGNGAGIGGGSSAAGNKVTINGGIVTAIGGSNGAGIGGGNDAAGSNIIINRGIVRATGGNGADGIGNGKGAASSSGIYVADGVSVWAGDTASPSNLILHTGTEDIAGKLKDKKYVIAMNLVAVPYIDENGALQSCTQYTVVEDSNSAVTWNAGWYVVGSDVTINNNVICNGDVKLILKDKSKLTVTGVTDKAGITVVGSGSLTVYGQSRETGALIVTGGANGAGIGGDYGKFVQNIYIYGGAVTATGGTGAAGIGSGNGGGDSSNIRVAGDFIVRAGDSASPSEEIPHETTEDIASKNGFKGKRYVTVKKIYTVTYDSNGATGGTVPVDSNEYAPNTRVTVLDNTGDLEKTGFNFTGWSAAQQPGEGDKVYNPGDKFNITNDTILYAQWSLIPVTYIDENGKEAICSKYTVATSSSAAVTWNAGWYVVYDNITLSKGAECNGAVNLILKTGTKLTASGVENSTAGIKVSGSGNSLTIYSQSGSGELNATGADYCAGIGGAGNSTAGDAGSNITINGGVITATGGSNGAGIGGGNATGSEITINGGAVTANGGTGAAGIGGGYNAAGSEITINGGSVTATGDGYGAGIGGGKNGAGSGITINGGAVTANGGNDGAGIGGGFNGDGREITISGGTVAAQGAVSGAGIGGGNGGVATDIKITGGSITATGAYGVSGIGNGASATGTPSIFAKDYIQILASDVNNPPEDTDIICKDHKFTENIATALAGKTYVKARATKTYTVTFDVQGHGTAPDSQSVRSGEKVSKPVNPTAEGYTFGGWYKEQGCANAWDFDSDTVTEDRTLYAKWTKKEYLIIWDAGAGVFPDGENHKNCRVEHGTTPEVPENPSQASTAEYTYIFNGWSPAVSPATHVQVYSAQYSSTKCKYNITFKNYDGTVLKSTDEEYGTTPSYSGTPTRPDDSSYYYTFAGWSPAVSVVTGSAAYTATYTSTKKSSGGGSSGGGGGSSGGGGESVSASSDSGITGAKAATTPITIAADGTQVMGTAIASKPLTMFTADEQRNIYGKGGQTAWVVSNGHYQLKDATGNLIKNQWAWVSDNLSSSGIGNVSKFYFDENGYMVIGSQWIKDADGIYRQYFFNDENGSLLGSCLMGGTKDDKILDENGQITGYVTKPAT